MYVDMLIDRLLKSYTNVPVHEDKSKLFFDKFVEWTNDFNNEIILFGYCKAAEKLIKTFPNAYVAIVDLDPQKQGRIIGGVPIISFEEYKKQKKDKIIITDINFQYVYLDLLYYEVLRPAGLITVDGLWNFKIRFNYEMKSIAYGNNPEIFDYDYLSIKKSLPMECTIPSDSVIRLIDCVKTSAELDGDILEVGTGEGGSTFIMASIIESYGLNKKIISVDGFEPQDYLPNLSYENVSKKLKRFPFVTLMKGYAPQILYSSHIDKIAFAFVDLYAFLDILEYVYAKVPTGGIILIDNYNHGCYHNHGKPIADVFFLDKIEKIIRVGGTQGLVVKQ